MDRAGPRRGVQIGPRCVMLIDVTAREAMSTAGETLRAKRPTPGRWLGLGLGAAFLLLAGACTAPPDPNRYRLANSGSHWDVSGDDRVLDDLRPRHPDFFAVILDPQQARLPDLRALRDDLEQRPVDRRNFDALNSVAIAYFESNYRAEAGRGDGLAYLALSQRSAMLLAVPWRAYSEIEDAALRDAILDFFEDAGAGDKLATAATAPRLERIVASLEQKEADPARRARIRSLAARLGEAADAAGR